MSNKSNLLNESQLIEVFNYTKTATAIHIGEEAVIQMANDTMLRIWGKDRSIIGKSLEAALPELVGQPFIEMFARVWREGLTLSGSDTAADLEVDGEVKKFYFNFEYRAIKDAEGGTICVLHTAIDVTEQVLNREALLQASLQEEMFLREQAMNEELAATNEELTSVNEELSQSQEELSSTNEELEKRIESRVKELLESEARFRTMAESTDLLISVLDEKGDVTYLNSSWSELTGIANDALLNTGWHTFIHSDDKADWMNIYASAFKQHIPFVGEFRLKAKDGDYKWVIAKYQPRFDLDNYFAGYIGSSLDITYRKKDEIEKLEMAGELAAINEEMMASNEELQAANEELVSAQEYLQYTFSKLEKSENRIRHMITAAPIAIAILNQRELIIESANDKMLEIWGKDTTVIGKPLREITTVGENKELLKILDKVFTTGEAYIENESLVNLEHEDKKHEVYLNFVFHPLKDEYGNTITILITANEVTEQVSSRQKVEEAEVALRLAIEAANFGTWHIHSVTRKFITSNRLKELFGFYPEDDITIDDAVGQITAEYRSYVSTTLENAIAGNGNYDVSYPVLGYHDKKIRWLRAIGNLKADPTGEFSAFTGVVMDISELKKDDERKNDFIGMVSHELKTPLTSLNGYIQILQLRSKNTEDTFIPGALAKANQQVKKMTNMINGFLNISRLESGKIVLNESVFRLDQLLANLVEEANIFNTTHHITYESDGAIEILADEDKVGNVISNLLSNAVKYSPQNKDITVDCIIVDGMARVSVKDQGMGIIAEDIEKLFERYYRVKNNHTISGFGIGLYLSAEIVARHKGKIWVESEPDEGATFYFTLPLKSPLIS